ncbi:GNAT family N-acetyltransferase [Streptomyces zaomyceticus]|uniref:GNAT family N-acetyltransferase n=1 Tax=Streptomyces zaomyceticus TaxID=68286 RepID=UPI0037B525CC
MSEHAARAEVRHARPDDLPRVVELVAEHAAYEKGDPPAPGLAGRLGRLLFGPEPPRLRCLVAVLPDDTLAGYATCAPELSTWDGAEYLHMDCLYLTETSRGHGLGPLLMAAVGAEAGRLGLPEVQWQTPAWNESAIRFYDRLGATSKEKRRYSLPVESLPKDGLPKDGLPVDGLPTDGLRAESLPAEG